MPPATWIPWRRLLGVVILGVVVFGACLCPPALRAEGTQAMDLGAPRKARSWTWIMVLNADCNLESSILDEIDMAERILADSLFTDDLHVVALVDRAKGYTDRDGDWTGAKVFEVTPGVVRHELASKELLDLGEIDIADPALLRSFVAGALKAFPSRQVLVSLSGHGNGWASCLPDEDAPGAKDGEDTLTVMEIHDALRGALDDTGHGPLDVLTFEACLMGQLDVAYALKDVTALILFTEGVTAKGVFSPSWFIDSGWILADRREAAARTLAGALGFYREGGLMRKCVSLTAIDTSKVDDVCKALDALVLKLMPTLDRDWPTYARALFRGENYIGTEDLERGPHATASFDLLDILDRMRLNHPDFPAQAEAEALEQAIEDAVLATEIGVRRRRSRGIAIYAPFRAENLADDYPATPFAKASKWAGFLAELHRRQQATSGKPRISTVRILDSGGHPAKAVQPLEGYRCEFVVEGPDLLMIEFGIGSRFKELGHLIQFETRHQVPVPEARRKGRSLAEQEMLFTPYVAGPNAMAQELGGIYLRLASGSDMVFATVTSGDRQVEVRGSLTDEGVGKDQDATIAFDPETWRVTSVMVHKKNKRGKPVGERQVAPSEKAVFEPILELVTWQGKRHGVPYGRLVWGDGPRLVLDVVAPGEQALFLQAVTVPGRKTVERVPFTVVENPSLTAALKEGVRLSLERLIGTWKIQQPRQGEQGKPTTFADTGGRLAIERGGDEGEGALLWRRWGDGALAGGKGAYEAVGLPTLSLHVENTWGLPLRKAFYVVLPGADGTVVLRDLASPTVSRLVREDDSGKALPGATDLVGTWQSKDGLKLTMTAKDFVMALNGDILDQGTWTVAGDRITVKNKKGETQTLTFHLEGNALTLENEDGGTFTLHRP